MTVRGVGGCRWCDGERGRCVQAAGACGVRVGQAGGVVRGAGEQFLDCIRTQVGSHRENVGDRAGGHRGGHGGS